MQVPRFYPILDTGLAERTGLGVVAAAEAILDGGARILQLRHKGHFSRDVFEWAEQIAERCDRNRALFVVNDRADMAALLGSALHLGQDDLYPADARQLLPPGRIIGFSTHNSHTTVGCLRRAGGLYSARADFSNRIEAESGPCARPSRIGTIETSDRPSTGCDWRHYSRDCARRVAGGSRFYRRNRRSVLICAQLFGLAHPGCRMVRTG